MPGFRRVGLRLANSASCCASQASIATLDFGLVAGVRSPNVAGSGIAFAVLASRNAAAHQARVGRAPRHQLPIRRAFRRRGLRARRPLGGCETRGATENRRDSCATSAAPRACARSAARLYGASRSEPRSSACAQRLALDQRFERHRRARRTVGALSCVSGLIAPAK